MLFRYSAIHECLVFKMLLLPLTTILKSLNIQGAKTAEKCPFLIHIFQQNSAVRGLQSTFWQVVLVQSQAWDSGNSPS